MDETDVGIGSWASRLPANHANALEMATRLGVPSAAVALYGRWWQLETWLRELFYVEMRAQFGQRLVELVDPRTLQRQERDEARAYMATPDWENPLAYLDAGKLFDLIGEQWDYFAPALIERRSWQGRREELLAIRHRIGHLRRPHVDDLRRVEQTLRDLERGAVRALRAYNRTYQPDQWIEDPVVQGWVEGRHQTARRLIAHAARQYETDIYVRCTVRPWSKLPEAHEQVSGSPGVIWHVRFHSRGGPYLRLPALWREIGRGSRQLLMHMLSDGLRDVVFTLPAVEDGNAVADAIGDLFDSVLMTSTWQPPPGWDTFAEDPPPLPRPDDARVLVDTAWNNVDDTTEPVSVFGA